tara:strand:+ start:388 stop:516 length:129 start_codon:yes stop_codon:yes gene_type:complete
MKKIKSKLGITNMIGLVIALTVILPIIVSITIKVISTKNIII